MMKSWTIDTEAMKNKVIKLWEYFFPSKVKEVGRQLVCNEVTCLECNETLISYSRHDYKTCSCPNKAMVDGGTAYGRYGAKDLNKIETFYVYDDDDFKFVRRYAARGGRGVDGKGPLTWVKLKDMNDDWLVAVLAYYPEGTDNSHLRLIQKEIDYRKKHRSSGKNV